jgi:hypothetical protein
MARHFLPADVEVPHSELHGPPKLALEHDQSLLGTFSPSFAVAGLALAVAGMPLA